MVLSSAHLLNILVNQSNRRHARLILINYVQPGFIEEFQLEFLKCYNELNDALYRVPNFLDFSGIVETDVQCKKCNTIYTFVEEVVGSAFALVSRLLGGAVRCVDKACKGKVTVLDPESLKQAWNYKGE